MILNLIKKILKTGSRTMVGQHLPRSVVQCLSCVRLLATPWTATHQASSSFTISLSLCKLMFIELVIPSNHLILCHPFLILSCLFASIRVFSSESALRIRWPKYWSFSFCTSPSNEYSGLSPFRIDWCDLQVWFQESSSTTVGKHKFFSAQPSLWFNFHIHTWLLENHDFDSTDLCQQSDVSAF